MVMRNRIGDVASRAVQIDARRQAMVTDLHFAVKKVSDEAMQYLLKVARSLAVLDNGPIDPRSLVGQTRVVVNSDGTARVAIVWSFHSEAFLSASYERDASGGWHSGDGKPISPTWLVQLEDRYQAKLREIDLAARSEVAC